ncbi:response regulator [Roseibacillus persicicus]|nr:response regulator transcription factor [Roseibacillus persicicus]
MIRILIADDHEMILRGLAEGFRAHPDFELVGAASSGPRTLELYQEARPDVVLLDYRMPGLDGDQITEEILKLDSAAKVIMFSSFEWEEDVWRSVLAGAMGYIPKTRRLKEIYHGIKEVAAGRQFFPAEILKKIRTRERREELTKREHEILRLLARGLDNKGIAKELGVSEPTVKSHVSHILAKVDANDRTNAVVKAARRGLIRLVE